MNLPENVISNIINHLPILDVDTLLALRKVGSYHIDKMVSIDNITPRIAKMCKIHYLCVSNCHKYETRLLLSGLLKYVKKLIIYGEPSAAILDQTKSLHTLHLINAIKAENIILPWSLSVLEIDTFEEIDNIILPQYLEEFHLVCSNLPKITMSECLSELTLIPKDPLTSTTFTDILSVLIISISNCRLL
jgi:hypothetical protein